MNQTIQLLRESLGHAWLTTVTHCCCAAFSCCTASSQPQFTFFSRNLRWFSTDSISSSQPCSSRASSYSNTKMQKNLLFITHEVWHNPLFIGEYRTCISQSKRSSSFRICSLSCLMSLDLSMAFEFTLQIQTRIIICNFSLLRSRPMVNEYEIYYWKDQCFRLFMTKKKKSSVTCSQDSSRLSFMLASRLFSSSTSLINFLRATYKKQQIRISAKQQKTCWLGTFK